MMTMVNKKISRQSFIEEDIEVKPSTELTPDEYEHFQNSVKNIEVHIFASLDDYHEQYIKGFSETLQKCGIEIKSENKHNVEEDDYNEILNKICEQSDTPNGLLILFHGYSMEDGSVEMFDGHGKTNVKIQDIWRKFSSHNCQSLKNKPKIFIFEVSPLKLAAQMDSGARLQATYELTYDTPAEADILIIYHKAEDPGDDFLSSVCDMIEQYGDTEDIISLVTCAQSIHSRPILISTLTRRFYFTASDMRGLHSVIYKNQMDLAEHVKDVKETICVKYPKKKEKRTFLSSFNFGKKSKDKRVQSESEDDIPEPKPSTRRTISNVPSRPTPTPARRPSTVTRPRTYSQTESESGKNSKSNKLKPWIP